MVRRLLPRLALAVGALLAVGLVLALAEGLLWAVGLERPRQDPFAGFSEAVPLFEREIGADGAEMMRTSAARRTRSQSAFPLAKQPGTRRIFVVGGSSAAGFPYGYDYAFPAFLEQLLADRLGPGRVEVVNAAVEGYASRRISAIVDELAGYEPDLLIVYSGHNELAERRFYAHLFEMDPTLFRLLSALSSTRLYGLAAGWLAPALPEAPPVDFRNKRALGEMFAVGEARLDAEGSARVDRELAYAELHYRFNLEHMIETMHEAGADVLLMGLSQNWSAWRPGLSRHRPDLTDEERGRFEVAYARAQAAPDCEGAIDHLRAALEIDSGHADALYDLARCQQRLGGVERAHRTFVAASDRDAVPHGAPSRYNEILEQLASSHGVFWLDADAALARERGDPLLGDDAFLDMVHPRISAHVTLAKAIAERLEAVGWLPARRADAAEPILPDDDDLRASSPDLFAREQLGRATACLLANRLACARAAIASVLEIEPEHADALRIGKIADQMERPR